MTTPAELGERALRRLGVAIVPVASRPALSATVAAATLATGALIELGVIAADETPAALDQSLALGKVDAVHDSLVSRGIVSWASSAVPQYAAEEYTKLTALVMATSFGKQADPAQWPALEERIRRAVLVQRAPDLATQAVMSVHQDLAARGKVRWTVFDIPVHVEDPYVMLAAYSLAPEFGMNPSQDDAKIAEVSLNRYISLPSSGERVPVEYF